MRTFKDRFIRVTAVLLLVCGAAWVLFAPLPEGRPVKGGPPSREEEEGLLGGAESVRVVDGSLTGHEGVRRLWELSASVMTARRQDIELLEARAALARRGLPDLVLAAPRIVCLPDEGLWKASGGIAGRSRDGLSFSAGRLIYRGREGTLTGEDGVSVAGKNWRVSGRRLEADTDLNKVSLHGRARFEYNYGEEGP